MESRKSVQTSSLLSFFIAFSSGGHIGQWCLLNPPAKAKGPAFQQGLPEHFLSAFSLRRFEVSLHNPSRKLRKAMRSGTLPCLSALTGTRRCLPSIIIHKLQKYANPANLDQRVSCCERYSSIKWEAMAPSATAVTTWRSGLRRTSPTAYTPGRFVRVVSSAAT